MIKLMLAVKEKTEELEISDNAKLRALPWVLGQGVFNTIFALWTFGGSIFLLFLNELGLAKGQIGALLSLFPFCGIIALWFAPMAARIGWKRVFIACYGTRKFVMALLLLLPWIIARFGHIAGLWWLASVLVIFSVLRALAETAYYPWTQEFIPNAVRGKFTGLSQVTGTLAAGVALFIAGNYIGHGTGLSRYMVLITIGCVSGIIGVLCMIGVPGGAPRLATETGKAHRDEILAVLKDNNFLAFLGGMGGITIGTMLMISFLPLYLKEKLGLSSGTVVMLDTVVMVGGALSSMLWGWAADRVGSRPVLMISLILSLLIPVGWLILPSYISNIVLWCIGFYFIYGVASNGSAVGSMRLLFNSVIPADRSTAYTAVYYAWLGITGGIAPLLAGWILSLFARQSVAYFLNGYELLFLLALILTILGLWSYGRVAPDDKYKTRDLIKIFADKLCNPKKEV